MKIWAALCLVWLTTGIIYYIPETTTTTLSVSCDDLSGCGFIDEETDPVYAAGIVDYYTKTETNTSIESYISNIPTTTTTLQDVALQPNIDSANITSGIISWDRLPVAVQPNIDTANITSGVIDWVRVNDLPECSPGEFVRSVANTLSCSWPLGGLQPNIDGANVTSGYLPEDRIPENFRVSGSVQGATLNGTTSVNTPIVKSSGTSLRLTDNYDNSLYITQVSAGLTNGMDFSFRPLNNYSNSCAFRMMNNSNSQQGLYFWCVDSTDRLFAPNTNNAYDLGTSSYAWKDIYAGTSVNTPLIQNNNGGINIYSEGKKMMNFAENDEVQNRFFFYNDKEASLSIYVYNATNTGAALTDASAQLWTGGVLTKLLFRGTEQILPYVTNSYDLGSSSYKWKDIYAGTSVQTPIVSSAVGSSLYLKAGGAGTFGRVIMQSAVGDSSQLQWLVEGNSSRLVALSMNADESNNGMQFYAQASDDKNIHPFANNQYDLGTSSTVWKTIYARAFNVGNSQRTIWTDTNAVAGAIDIRCTGDNACWSGLWLTPDGGNTSKSVLLYNNPGLGSDGMVMYAESAAGKKFYPHTDNAYTLGDSTHKWKTVYRYAEASDWFIGRDFTHIFIKNGTRYSLTATGEELRQAGIIEDCEYVEPIYFCVNETVENETRENCDFTKTECSSDGWKYTNGKNINNVDVYLKENKMNVNENINNLLYDGELLTNSKGLKIESSEKIKVLNTIKTKDDGMLNHDLIDVSLTTDSRISIDKRLNLLEQIIQDMAKTLCEDKHYEYC